MVYDPQGFVHLHVHSHYSTLDGSMRMEDLCIRARKLGMPAIALTDHGNMFGALDFQEQALKAAVKPIFGSEFYLAPRGMGDRSDKTRYHLLLLAETQEGYRNLCRLSSISYIEGFYYKPRIDKEVLAEHAGGLIMGSACLNGELPKLLREGKRDKAREAALQYAGIAGKGNFFIELMDHGLPEQKAVNRELVSLARELDIPLIATNDVHFLSREDYEASEILVCIGNGEKLSNPNRFRINSDQYYMKSTEEMRALFSELPDALENTVRIAERCNVVIETVETAPAGEKYKIPVFDVPGDMNEDQYLARLCEEGLARRYPQITDDIRQRLNYELEVISNMRFSGYFLIVWDLVHFAKSHGIPVGPGRGSAAGSIVSYSLGITDVDPLQFGLFFERFLNPSRISMPDIDIDFCVARRNDVIDYIKRKYGFERVAQIITYSYMKARAVLKDVGRVLEFDFQEANKISSLVPAGANTKISLATAFNESPELREYRKQGGRFEKLFRVAQKLENVIRHVGIHAAGVVIANRPLVDYLPIYKDTKSDNLVSQFDGPHLEKVGLLKMDILGLKNLTTMEECRKLVRDNHGLHLDFDSLPYDDQKTYHLLQQGRSLGVFQLDSAGMQQLLKDLQPQTFSEIIALIALYRPGPLNQGMHTRFVNRKHGREKTEYLFPELEPILRDTFGIIIYQEQVMQISRTIGGFSMADADKLRKAMGKKIKEIVAKMRVQFLDGAKARKFDKKRAEQLYDLMSEFAEYGFNKSHSTAYAMISYRTAYLKANYPLEYMAALLTSEKDGSDREKLAQYIREARDMGIKVLPPDVNFSGINFTVEQGAIRFGLSAIKGVGESASGAILRGRDDCGFFKNLIDFCKAVDLQGVNRRVLEILVACGAFSSTGKKRSVLAAELENALEKGLHIQADRESGQGNFFDTFMEVEEETSRNLDQDLAEWPAEKLFELERDHLGIYLTGHPLGRFQRTIKRLNATASSELDKVPGGQRVRLAGLIRDIAVKTSRDGNPYAVVQLEDMEGTVEVIFFSTPYQKNRQLLSQGTAVLVTVTVNRQQFRSRPSYCGEKVALLQEAHVRDLHIYLEGERLSEDMLFRMREELIDSRNRGKSPVFFHVSSRGKTTTIRANQGITVNPSRELLDQLKQCEAVAQISLE